jgi:putative transposase
MDPLQPDTSFHIFNHANGFENVFREKENFRYFLEKYYLYISPIAETYAYCLMPNHFHLVIRIRKRQTIEALIRNKNIKDLAVTNISKLTTFSKVLNFGNVEEVKITDKVIERYLSKQFANLFSCYTQSFNKVYHRMGSLFIKNFKREPIFDKQHFLNMIVYTHRNPIKQGFRKNYTEWDFSSYQEITNGVCDHIAVIKLLKMTGGLAIFKEMHRLALENMDNPNEF